MAILALFFQVLNEVFWIGVVTPVTISASLSQVGIICACGATHPMPEHCCLFIAFLYCMIGFKELLSLEGDHHSNKDCYDLIRHIVEYSLNEL